jgi:transketolase
VISSSSIILRSVIGYGSPNKADTSAAHGAALGEDEVRLTKENLGWDGEQSFVVPDGVRAHFDEGIGARGKTAREAWDAKFNEYKAAHPELAAEWQLAQDNTLPEGWDNDIPTFETDPKGLASRASAGQVLNAIAQRVPSLIGGSADLAPSTNTLLKFDGAGHFGADDYAGRNFHFGIREHAMAAICNGMALTGIRPYGATFFVFSDYLRPSLRLAALMRLPVLTVLTHDSIGVGEDGPTHQPIEQLAAARSIPRLIVMRPGDANEVAEAYRTIMPINDRPVAMILTRQNLPTLDRSKYASAEGVAKGGYILADAEDGKPQVILLATGSEVSLCISAYETLKAEGISARVVSMPSFELFEDQDAAYRESVLPSNITARVAVEAGIQQGWGRYLGLDGRFVGMHDFGASAPASELSERFGITSQAVVAAAKDIAS